jgi:hypothetical protein
MITALTEQLLRDTETQEAAADLLQMEQAHLVSLE